MDVTPFTTIESAEEFLELLDNEIQKVKVEIEELVAGDDGSSPRRLEALRLVLHKINQLQAHTSASLRLLNDLRSLRTLLMK